MGCVVDGVHSTRFWQIQRRSASQGIWWLKKESCCPLPNSNSLITVERKNLKGAGEKISACLQLVVTVVYIYINWYTYDGYINIYSFLFSMAFFCLVFFLATVQNIWWHEVDGFTSLGIIPLTLLMFCSYFSFTLPPVWSFTLFSV